MHNLLEVNILCMQIRLLTHTLLEELSEMPTLNI